MKVWLYLPLQPVVVILVFTEYESGRAHTF